MLLYNQSMNMASLPGIPLPIAIVSNMRLLSETIATTCKGARSLFILSSTVATLEASSFAGLAEIQTLWIVGPTLALIGSDAFARLPDLSSLKLDFEEYEGVAAGMFKGLRRLKLLDIGLQEAGSAWAHGKITLESNTGLHQLPAGMFEGLHDLKWLKIERSQLQKLPANAFSGLANIELISLWGSMLSTIDPAAFKGLASLKRLQLGQNQLVSLNWMENGAMSDMGNLEYLGMARNRNLEHIRPNMFTGLASLQTLNLQGCNIKYIADGSFTMHTPLLHDITMGNTAKCYLPGFSPTESTRLEPHENPSRCGWDTMSAKVICNCTYESGKMLDGGEDGMCACGPGKHLDSGADASGYSEEGYSAAGKYSPAISATSCRTCDKSPVLIAECSVGN